MSPAGTQANISSILAFTPLAHIRSLMHYSIFDLPYRTFFTDYTGSPIESGTSLIYH